MKKLRHENKKWDFMKILFLDSYIKEGRGKNEGYAKDNKTDDSYCG